MTEIELRGRIFAAITIAKSAQISTVATSLVLYVGSSIEHKDGVGGRMAIPRTRS